MDEIEELGFVDGITNLGARGCGSMVTDFGRLGCRIACMNEAMLASYVGNHITCCVQSCEVGSTVLEIFE